MSRELQEKVLEKLTQHVLKGPENCGYFVADVGGNMTAWRRDFANRSFALISDKDGSHEFNREVVIGLYRNSEDNDPLLWEIQLDQEGKVLWT